MYTQFQLSCLTAKITYNNMKKTWKQIDRVCSWSLFCVDYRNVIDIVHPPWSCLSTEWQYEVFFLYKVNVPFYFCAFCRTFRNCYIIMSVVVFKSSVWNIRKLHSPSGWNGIVPFYQLWRWWSSFIIMERLKRVISVSVFNKKKKLSNHRLRKQKVRLNL